MNLKLACLIICIVHSIHKGCGNKSVYFQRIASIWRYKDLFPHPLKLIFHIFYAKFWFHTYLKLVNEEWHRKTIVMKSTIFNVGNIIILHLNLQINFRVSNFWSKIAFKKVHQLNYNETFCSALPFASHPSSFYFETQPLNEIYHMWNII